jgi:hypothetical protein
LSLPIEKQAALFIVNYGNLGRTPFDGFNPAGHVFEK